MKSIILAIHLAALSQIESGDNDNAVGKAGEITRYQVLPEVLHQNGFGTADVDGHKSAAVVAKAIWEKRVDQFIKAHSRQPSDAELYLLWHRPARVMKPTRKELARAERFANLLGELKRETIKN